MGTTTEAIRRMGRGEQLHLVEKYLTPFRGRLNSLVDVYLAVFRGFIIKGRGTRQSSSLSTIQIENCHPCLRWAHVRQASNGKFYSIWSGALAPEPHGD
jgi:hypothetical protein